MYVQMFEGLGKDLEKNGHIRQVWSECKREGTRQRMCDIAFRVKNRPSFEDFRREVERAFGRWMTGARARMLVKKREAMLKKLHQNIPDNYSLNAPVCIRAEIIYRGLNGTWRVVDVLPGSVHMFSKALIEKGQTSC